MTSHVKHNRPISVRASVIPQLIRTSSRHLDATTKKTAPSLRRQSCPRPAAQLPRPATARFPSPSTFRPASRSHVSSLTSTTNGSHNAGTHSHRHAGTATTPRLGERTPSDPPRVNEQVGRFNCSTRLRDAHGPAAKGVQDEQAGRVGG